MTPTASRAGSFKVDAGWDLFQTAPGTTFPGLGPLAGIPLGTFDFGPPPGMQNVGTTDTIVQRLSSPVASPLAIGGTGTTGLLMNALQLETIAPVNFGGNGLDNYFVTLQSRRGGPASTGSMTITWLTGTSGTFSSSIDVFFDIRKGSLSGPIVFSTDLVETSSGTVWSDLPPPGSLEIPGVNTFLNGTDRTADFWPLPGVVETFPNGAVHVELDTVPEPATLTLAALGIAGLCGSSWRKRKAAAA
jgi:hypothetical protein